MLERVLCYLLGTIKRYSCDPTVGGLGCNPVSWCEGGPIGSIQPLFRVSYRIRLLASLASCSTSRQTVKMAAGCHSGLELPINQPQLCSCLPPNIALVQQATNTAAHYHHRATTTAAATTTTMDSWTHNRCTCSYDTHTLTHQKHTRRITGSAPLAVHEPTCRWKKRCSCGPCEAGLKTTSAVKATRPAARLTSMSRPATGAGGVTGGCC